MIHPPRYWPVTGWVKGWNGASADTDDALPDAIDTKDVTAGYSAAKLDPESDAFQAIADYIRRNIADFPYTSERGEKTRMAWAKDQAEDTILSPLQRQAAARRMNEKNDKSIAPPSSRPVTVRKIRVIRNLPLWEMYENYRTELTDQLSKGLDRSNPLAGIIWSARLQSNSPGGLRCLPVMNESIGEVMLFHGTSKNFIKMIVEGGFRPELGRNKGTVANPQFGMLGQGTYFTDSFSKMMTYAGCKLCGDFECNCRSAITRRKIARTCILSRVLLGIPEFYGSKVKAALRIGQHKANHAGYKQTSFDENRGGQYSVFSQGYRGVGNNLISFGSGANEMLARRTQQLYPEFVLSYVLGDDDVAPPLIEAVRRGIQTYERRTHWNQSRETKNALTKLKDTIGQGDTALMIAVCYFLSCKPTTDVPGLIPAAETRDRYGARLKRDSQFRKDLFEAVKASGYVY